jgi:hyperosmotically inducible protein
MSAKHILVGARSLRKVGARWLRDVGATRRHRGTIVGVAIAVLAFGCGRTDPALLSAVSAQLAVDPTIATLRLDVSVARGVVHLRGDTNSRAEQERAIEIARAVRGVREVVNEMHISDERIAENVRKALTADQVLVDVPIDVDSADGHVRLHSSQTNSDQRQRAVQLAKAVEGVTSVEDRMR